MVSGHCLCGATTVNTGDESPDSFILCHCTDCQRTSGTAFSSNVLIPDAKLKIEGKVGKYESKAKSGNVMTRFFCSQCGCAMAHKSAAFGDATAVQCGAMLEYFKDKPISTELWTKGRWSGFKAIPNAAQVVE